MYNGYSAFYDQFCVSPKHLRVFVTNLAFNYERSVICQYIKMNWAKTKKKLKLCSNWTYQNFLKLKLRFSTNGFSFIHLNHTTKLMRLDCYAKMAGVYLFDETELRLIWIYTRKSPRITNKSGAKLPCSDGCNSKNIFLYSIIIVHGQIKKRLGCNKQANKSIQNGFCSEFLWQNENYIDRYMVHVRTFQEFLPNRMEPTISWTIATVR